MKKVSQSTLIGAAGENFVMFKLLRMNLVAAHAPKGAPNADILVSDVAGKRTAVLQVKTRRDIGSDKGWHMKEKHETIRSNRMFYCFVDLGSDEKKLPTVFVIPSRIVADALQKTHQIWLKTPGKKGQKHRPTEMRRLLPDWSKKLPLSSSQIKKFGPGWIEKHRENWTILGLN